MSENRPTEAAPRKTKSRWVRWARRAALGLLLVIALLFVTYAIASAWAGRVVRREIVLVRAADEPLNLDELRRTDRDGHVQATASVSPAGPLLAVALPMAEKWQATPGFEAYEELAKGTGPVLNPPAALGASLAEYGEALDLLRRAAVQDEAVVVLPGVVDWETQLPPLSQTRAAYRLLAAWALYRAAAHDADGATEALVSFGGVVHCVPGSNLISFLVYDAVIATYCRTIERASTLVPFSSAQWSRISDAVRNLMDDTPLALPLCGERVFASPLFLPGSGPVDAAWDGAGKGFRRFSGAGYYPLMRCIIAAARQPFPESLAAVRTLQVEYAHPTLVARLGASLLAPALVRAFEEAAAGQARLRLELAGLAVRRALAEGKPLPATLADLTPTYLETVPFDPFTGKPLTFRLDGNTAVIHSVGVDGHDDGGVGSLATGGKPGEDIVLRMTP